MATKSFPQSQAWLHQSQVLDVLLPKYYEYDMQKDISCHSYSSSSFRSSSRDDSELFLDQDCDALYADTLLKSEFTAWLESEDSSPSSHPTAQSVYEVFSSPSVDRLRMLLEHIYPSDSSEKRGKKKA